MNVFYFISHSLIYLDFAYARDPCDQPSTSTTQKSTKLKCNKLSLGTLLLRPWEGCEVLRSACLSVCLFVCLFARVSQKPQSKLHEIFCTCYL